MRPRIAERPPRAGRWPSNGFCVVTCRAGRNRFSLEYHPFELESSQCRNCFVISGEHLVKTVGRGAQVAQQPVLESVNPPMNAQLLSTFPGIPRYGGLANVGNLFDYV